jgi:hypothetical protein
MMNSGAIGAYFDEQAQLWKGLATTIKTLPDDDPDIVRLAKTIREGVFQPEVGTVEVLRHVVPFSRDAKMRPLIHEMAEAVIRGGPATFGETPPTGSS